MAEYEVPPATPAASQPPVTATLVAYILFAAAAVIEILGRGLLVPAPLLTLIGIIGVIVAYVNRADARGTWVESHLTWLIRTFWWSTLWAVIGWIVLIALAVVIIGFALGPLIWVVTSIWVIYRVVRGVLLFKDNRPIPGV
jgi:uncharacterized membrane protein